MADHRDRMIVVTPCADASAFPRINKMLGVLGGLELDFDHWYWVRGDESLPPGRVLHRGGGFKARLLIFHYVLFMARLFWAVLRKGRGKRYYCLGFASAFPVSLASRIVGADYLFDNNDNLAMSYRWPRFVKAAIQACERAIVRRAVIHLVPSLTRWKGAEPNLRVVANVPSSDNLRQAQEQAAVAELERGEILTLYINGLLTDERGMKPLLAVLEGWRTEVPLRVLAAGRIQSESARLLLEHPQVEYLGVLSNIQALSHYAEAHVVLTYYDPRIEINRLAEPNKWGDCVMMGAPFIVNSEVESAEPFVARGACFSVPYDDVSGLRLLLESLVQDRERLRSARKALASFSWKPWEVQFRSVIEEFVNSPERCA